MRKNKVMIAVNIQLAKTKKTHSAYVSKLVKV